MDLKLLKPDFIAVVLNHGLILQGQMTEHSNDYF